ncbi:MAG: sulfatase [Planctomycetota bacterium]
MLAALLLTVPFVSPPAGERPPNVVLIVVDDMGWKDLGCYGSTYYRTPHVDRLAAEGVRFTQGYAACAVCSPSRAALLTGRYPQRIGVTDWIHHDGPEAREAMEADRNVEGFDRPRGRRLLTPRNHAWLEPSEVTLAELLRAEGYATCHVGKWHLGPDGHSPETQGFDENHGGNQLGHPPSYFDPYSNKRWSLTGLPSRAEGEYLTDREVDEALGFIERNRERPFLLYLAHYAVHSPIQAKPDKIAGYEEGEPGEQSFPAYAAMVESVDDGVGRILAALDAHGLDDDTLVVFTSDNGGAVHFRATDNSPLRKGKGYAYEGGLRVPLIVRWPAGAPNPRAADFPASGIDLLPTIAAAVGVELPADRPLDGVDLGPVLRGENDPDRDVLVWHFPHYWWGTRIQPYSVLREGRWKLIYRYESGAAELYDLAADPGEADDLAASKPAEARRLLDRLHTLLAAQGARMPEPNPEYVGD